MDTFDDILAEMEGPLKKPLFSKTEIKSQMALVRESIVTQDNDTIKTIERAEFLASYDIPVLITGPTGTGKELFARLLHGNRQGKFVAVNCGGIPDTLIESEFFGHEKGAFTGATSRREGFFEEARDGTIFLDEIAELPRFLQSKLLRVLQEKKIRRIGGSVELPINCRIVSATNHMDLETDEKIFRQDLYFRLAGTRIYLKSLMERGLDEVKILWTYFTEGKLLINDHVIGHTWPGNIRELKNYAEECVIFSKFIAEETKETIL